MNEILNFLPQESVIGEQEDKKRAAIRVGRIGLTDRAAPVEIDSDRSRDQGAPSESDFFRPPTRLETAGYQDGGVESRAQTTLAVLSTL